MSHCHVALPEWGTYKWMEIVLLLARNSSLHRNNFRTLRMALWKNHWPMDQTVGFENPTFQNCGVRLFEYLFSTDRCLKTKEKLLRLMIFSHDFTFLAGFQMTTFLYMFVIELLCFPWKLITSYQDVSCILTWNSFRKKNRTKNLDELKRSTQISIWQRLK